MCVGIPLPLVSMLSLDWAEPFGGLTLFCQGLGEAISYWTLESFFTTCCSTLQTRVLGWESGLLLPGRGHCLLGNISPILLLNLLSEVDCHSGHTLSILAFLFVLKQHCFNEISSTYRNSAVLNQPSVPSNSCWVISVRIIWLPEQVRHTEVDCPSGHIQSWTLALVWPLKANICMNSQADFEGVLNGVAFVWLWSTPLLW